MVDTIFYIVDNDLHIHFGWKSYRVSTRLVKNAGLYIKRSLIRSRIKSLGLTATFLRPEEHLVLLEADATLLGLYKSVKILEIYFFIL